MIREQVKTICYVGTEDFGKDDELIWVFLKGLRRTLRGHGRDRCGLAFRGCSAKLSDAKL